jgi:PBP4 family serine-type D-alanyl-D-alanine carboxypeptidase
MRRAADSLWLQVVLFGVILFLSSAGFAQTNAGLAARIDRIIEQPGCQHASFGIEVYSLSDNKVLYARNAQKLFTPGSTTKLLTEGSALELLGPDYRFHTRIYRTGPISSNGTLHGDLVLVADGDPNLSGRIRPDGTLAFIAHGYDHTYGGDRYTKAVPGDPLLVIHELAERVASRGIRRVDGRVLVDVSLFPEGEPEPGTGAVISPIVVNDNLVDVIVTPGGKPGDPVQLHVSPVTPYAKFISEATTVAASSEPSIGWTNDQIQPGGLHVITVGGTMPAGGPGILYSYKVRQPSHFAEMALVEALRQDGVQADFAPYGQPVDFAVLSPSYTDRNLVAEHVSPPFSEEVRVTLKVSQNLHASMTPYILGAVLAHARKNILQAGFDLEHGFLEKAGLDLSSASQSDGAGGDALFTPGFICHYLAYMARQKDFAEFERALPILGRDGTLFNTQVNSPAAGHVFAKTGTIGGEDLLNRDLMITGKGLAGYVTATNGRRYAIALYANRVSLPLGDLDEVENTIGQTLGEIASSIYAWDQSRRFRAGRSSKGRQSHGAQDKQPQKAAASVSAPLGSLDGKGLRRPMPADSFVLASVTGRIWRSKPAATCPSLFATTPASEKEAANRDRKRGLSQPMRQPDSHGSPCRRTAGAYDTPTVALSGAARPAPGT